MVAALSENTIEASTSRWWSSDNTVVSVFSLVLLPRTAGRQLEVRASRIHSTSCIFEELCRDGVKKKLTSTEALGVGFTAILALLVYSTFEAAALQRVGGERQAEAHRRFVEQDDAITEVRRVVWLGGIYARDYFLNRGQDGLTRLSDQLRELERGGLLNIAILRRAAPARLKELGIESRFDEFIQELRDIDSPYSQGRPHPTDFIEEVIIPRRLTLLGLFEEFRASVRQELVDAQIRYDHERAAAGRKLSFFLAAALLLGVLVALSSIRYSARVERDLQAGYNAVSLAKRELEDLSSRLIDIQEQERRALSQELHDEVGQTLTALRMELSHAITLVRDDGSRERLLRARVLAENTVQMVRDISLMLRPSLLDDLGLGAALQWQLERFSARSGIACEFEGSDVGENLPDSVKTCVFRIAQEALNNCEKYAAASNVRVVLQHDRGRLSLEVRDDGCGMVVDERGLPSRGTGILGMKERAQKLGGSVLVDSLPGSGTRIALTLPVAAPVAKELQSL